MNQAEQEAPAARGYRMPAEWERHEATWLSWPHNRETWPGSLERAEAAMVELVAALAERERVRINVLGPEHRRYVGWLLAGCVPPENVGWHEFPTNDAWIRDHGAVFVVRNAGSDPLLALDFEYNVWGGKYPPYDLDRGIARWMADAVGVPCRSPGIVLEGGSVDNNGAGTVLTTEQCLLNDNRNPGLDRAAIETVLADSLGATHVIWLGDGIVGDDTDGHIDNLTRFVDRDTVVTAIEPNAADPNHAALQANRDRLAAARLADGASLEVIELPMPAPVFAGGRRLPASYANFYVGNGIVAVPVFGCAEDEQACAILGTCFPGRRVVPIDCTALAVGLGALHCLTQQLPAVPRAG